MCDKMTAPENGVVNVDGPVAVGQACISCVYIHFLRGIYMKLLVSRRVASKLEAILSV
jgi:hypothetical protein